MHFHYSTFPSRLVLAGVRVDAPPFPRSLVPLFPRFGLNITLICSNEMKVHLSGVWGVGTTPSLTSVTFICRPAGCCDAVLFPPQNHSECVCLCTKVTRVSVCDSCLGLNNRSSVPISGGRVPGDLALASDWLAPHGEKFTLEGAPRLIFFSSSSPLPIKCGMWRTERPFGVF